MLKNYSSQVSVSRSIAFIEGKLIAAGAQQILKEYDDQKRISAIMFAVPLNGINLHFQLPVKTAACERILRSRLSSRAKPETHKRIGEQAERTAWKILSDWVEVQMSMIELAQVDFMEVFLPYVYDPMTQRTVYQMAHESGFKKLLPAGE